MFNSIFSNASPIFSNQPKSPSSKSVKEKVISSITPRYNSQTKDDTRTLDSIITESTHATFTPSFANINVIFKVKTKDSSSAMCKGLTIERHNSNDAEFKANVEKTHQEFIGWINSGSLDKHLELAELRSKSRTLKHSGLDVNGTPIKNQIIKDKNGIQLMDIDNSNIPIEKLKPKDYNLLEHSEQKRLWAERYELFNQIEILSKEVDQITF